MENDGSFSESIDAGASKSETCSHQSSQESWLYWSLWKTLSLGGAVLEHC